jgi:hypothetical protein
LLSAFSLVVLPASQAAGSVLITWTRLAIIDTARCKRSGVSGKLPWGILTVFGVRSEVAVLRKTLCHSIVVALLLSLQPCCCSTSGQEELKPVFELDCVNFAGRFLAEAPAKKKTHPGLAADGTTWSIAPDNKCVVITRIFPGEAAEKAGLQTGDEIISVNGYQTDGAKLRDLFCAYHMYSPDTMTETLIVQKKDGSKNTVKLTLLTLDKCNAEEKHDWLNIYKGLGY